MSFPRKPKSEFAAPPALVTVDWTIGMIPLGAAGAGGTIADAALTGGVAAAVSSWGKALRWKLNFLSYLKDIRIPRNYQMKRRWKQQIWWDTTSFLSRSDINEWLWRTHEKYFYCIFICPLGPIKMHCILQMFSSNF